MNKQREIGTPDLRDMRLVAKLAAAYTLLELAPYTQDIEFGPADMAVYVYKTHKNLGQLGRLWQIMDIE